MRPERVLFVVLGLLLASSAFPQDTACDRACLETTVDRFLDAFIKHDPKQVPLTRTVRFTENGQLLTVGDGSWRSMIGKGTYRLFVSDPRAGQVAFIGTLREESQQNTEIELFGVRNENAAKKCEKLGTPNRLFQEAVQTADRI